MVPRTGRLSADVGVRYLSDRGRAVARLETEAYGDANGLVEELLTATDAIGVDATIVAPDEWEHGSAHGVCERRSPTTTNPVVEVVGRTNRADLASTLIHEFAHAIMHFEREPGEEKSRLEVEAEAVAYIVSRHFGLDPDNSAFYLAAWDEDAPTTVRDRLDRISSTAAELIDAIEN